MDAKEKLSIEAKLDEILTKIPEGEKRYRNSALTHTIVDGLLHGNDPVVLIGQLIVMHEKLQEDYREFITKSFQ